MPILALSISERIEQYGAYAGFASVLGLAVLSLLYFSQSREVKRLREWAGRAPERAAEQQAAVTAQAQQKATTPPPAVTQPPRPAATPATPAAAAAAATPAAVSAAATPAGQATAVVPPATPPATPGTPTPTPTPPPGTPPAPPTPPADATKDGPAVPVTATTPAPPVPPAKPIPAQPLRVPPSTRRASEPEPEPTRSAAKTTLAILGAAVVVIIGIVIGTGALSSGDDKEPETTIANGPSTVVETTDDGSTTPKASTGAVVPSKVTVAVLNGTDVPGLARGAANKLQGGGFNIGTVTNAAEQTRSATLVEYVAGKRKEALAVAKLIQVNADAVKQIDPGTRLIAGQEAIVVVTVGADQNQAAAQ